MTADTAAIERAARLLEQGKLVALPTEVGPVLAATDCREAIPLIDRLAAYACERGVARQIVQHAPHEVREHAVAVD